MTDIPRSQRQNLPASGSQLPSPSFARTQFAGAGKRADAVTGRGIAAVSDTIQKISIVAMRANDNSEFTEATIGVQSEAETSLATLKKNIQDPDVYEEAASKEIAKIASAAKKKVGFRNRKRFDNVLLQLDANARKVIIKEKFGKTVDREKASLESVKDLSIEEMITKGKSSTDAINDVNIKLVSMVQTGIISQEDFVTETKKFAVRAKTEEFLATYKDDPEAAIRKIETDPDLTAEQKTDIIFKMSSRINKFNKELAKATKKEMADKMVATSQLIDKRHFEDIDELRDMMTAQGFDYKTRKTLESDYQDIVTGNTIEDARAFDAYADEIMSNPNEYSDIDIAVLEDLSSTKRTQLLDLKTRLLSNPMFSNPFFKEGMKAIENEYARGLLDKLDEGKQSRKVDSRLEFIRNIERRLKEEEKVEKGKKGLSEIISEEVDKIVATIRKSKGKITVRGEGRTDADNKRAQQLLKKMQLNRATPEEIDEYDDLRGLGK